MKYFENNSVRVLRRLAALALLSLGGSSVGLAQDIIFQKFGQDFDGRFDGGFKPIGDVNQDGVRDFILGMPAWNKHSVISGADWSELASAVVTNTNPVFMNHGHSVAGVGDWDGDGIPDYMVGEPAYSPGWPATFSDGKVVLYSGATHTSILEITHGVAEERLGSGVYGLGDITGDGWPEIAIHGGTFIRKLWIYSAPSGTLLRVHSLVSTISFDPIALPDLDGDGIVDYAFGEEGYSDAGVFDGGRVVVFSGATGQELHSFPGQLVLEQAGVSVARGGDWNADGVEDIVAGAPGAPGLHTSSAYPTGVYVFSGLDGQVLRHFDGLDYVDAPTPEHGPNFGYDVDSGADVNGDGFPDLIVGAVAALENGSWEAGAALVISGRSGAVLWYHAGTVPGQHVGQDVAFLEDFDGDGLDEWILVDPDYPVPGAGFGATGSVTIYRGAVGDRWNACAGMNPAARLFAAGSLGLEDNGLQLSVEGAPPNLAGFLITGSPAPSAAFGGGRLCLGPPFALFATLATDGSGNAWLPLDLSAPPFDAGPAALQPGDTRAFQFLYRDPQTGGRNASDSVVVQFLP